MFLKVSTSLTNCIPQCRLAQRISILSPPHSRPTPNYNSQRNLTWQIDLWPWIWNSVNTLHNRSLKTCFILSDISPRTIVTTDYGHPMKASEIWKFWPIWQTKYASAVQLNKYETDLYLLELSHQMTNDCLLISRFLPILTVLACWEHKIVMYI